MKVNLSIAGEELRSARVRAGLSQERLAEVLRVSIRTVGAWERDQVPAHRAPIVQDWLDQLRPSLTSFSSAELVDELERRGIVVMSAVTDADLMRLRHYLDAWVHGLPTRRAETQPLPEEDEPGWTGQETSGKLDQSPGGGTRSRFTRGRGPSASRYPPSDPIEHPVPDPDEDSIG